MPFLTRAFARLAFTIAVTIASTARAQTSVCDTYVGRAVTPTTFDAAAAILKRFPAEKGEYETTTAYEARLAAARAAIPSTLIITSTLDPTYLKYNADAGSLEVVAYALRNINTDYSSVFGYGTPYYEKVKYSSFDNIDWVLSETESVTGSFVGSNAFGAQVLVNKILRIDKSIFQGEAEFGTDLWSHADR